MAIEHSFYDYNGIIFIFGKIDSTFNANWSMVNKVVVIIDDNYTYQSDIRYQDSTRVVFNLNTHDHRGSGTTKEQFSKGEHTVKAKFYNGTTQIGSTQTLNQVIVHASLTTPTISFDKENQRLIISRSETGTSSNRPRYFCEIRRKNRNIVNTDYTEDEKDYFYTVVMKGIEGGKFNEAHPHTTLMSYDRENTPNLQSPYSEIDVAVNSYSSPVTIKSNYTYVLTPQTEDDVYYFKFIPSDTGYYTFSSYNSSNKNDSRIKIYSDSSYSDEKLIASSDDYGEKLDFICIEEFTKSKTYYIKVSFWAVDGSTKLHISPKRGSVDSEPLLRYNRRRSFDVNVVFDTQTNYTNYRTTCLDLVESSLQKLQTIIEESGYSFDYTITDSGVCTLYKKDSTYLNWSDSFDLYYNQFGNTDDFRMTVRFGNNSTTQMDSGVQGSISKSGQLKQGGTTDGANQGKWGTWIYYDASSGVQWSYATINIDHASEYETLSHVTHEEMYQSLGIGDDCYNHEESIHWDPEYSNPESYEGIDRTILKMLYTSDIRGYSAFDCINHLDTPCLMFREYSQYDSNINGFDFSLLDEFGNLRLNPGQYVAYAWCASEGTTSSSGGATSAIDGWDDDPYSLKSSCEFTIGELSLWSWAQSNGQATDVQTRKAYKAITKEPGYYIDDFSHLVWNDLVDKTMDAIESHWLTSDNDGNSYLSYKNTQMSGDDKILTATKFNALRFNIGSRIPTGISQKFKGDVVKGNYFIALTNCLNAIINGSTGNYVTYPIGKDVGNPYIEDNAGGYYYKYSNGYGIKSVSTDVDFHNVVMQYNLEEDTQNNGFIFLTCNSNYASNGPEFGICSIGTKNHNGKWVCYTREACSTELNIYENIVVFDPSTIAKDDSIFQYTYEDAEKITMAITLEQDQIHGKIWRGTDLIFDEVVDGSGVGINENGDNNIFLLGASYVPDPPTTSPSARNSFLKNLYLENGCLYGQVGYTGNVCAWVPDENNEGTYFALIVRPAYTTYTRTGDIQEKIDISYE